MAIQETDLKDYKSTVEDDTDNCGGAIDTGAEIISGVDNNLFPDITGDEAAAGVTKWRKSFRKNTHAEDDWLDVKTWITGQPVNAALHIALGINHADDIKGKLSELDPFSGPENVALVSDGADTRDVVVMGVLNGAFVEETVALDGASEVLSVSDFDDVYCAYPTTLDGDRTITIKEGSGGSAIGTIAGNGKLCTQFKTAEDIDTKAEGFRHGDIVSGDLFGLWYKLVVPESAGLVRANSCETKSEGDTA